MDNRFLGQGFSVSPIFYGAMGLSEFYGASPPDEQSLAVLGRALDLGVTMFDTADMYGLGHNEKLLGRFFKTHKTDQAAGRIKVATKFGIERRNGSYERRINNSPEYICQACEGSLKRLGLERIDLYSEAQKIRAPSEPAFSPPGMDGGLDQGRLAKNPIHHHL